MEQLIQLLTSPEFGQLARFLRGTGFILIIGSVLISFLLVRKRHGWTFLALVLYIASALFAVFLMQAGLLAANNIIVNCLVTPLEQLVWIAVVVHLIQYLRERDGGSK